MATFTHSSWLFSLPNTKPKWDPQTPLIFPSLKTPKRSSFASGSLGDDVSPPASSDSPYVSEEAESDRVKLAFDKAREYGKSSKFDQFRDNVEDPVAESPVEKASQGIEMEMRIDQEFQMMGSQENDDLSVDGDDEKEIPATLRIAMKKAKEYKESKDNASDSGTNEDVVEENIPEALRIAMEKAREYKKNKGASVNNSNTESLKLPRGSGGSLGDGNSVNNIEKSEELKISSIDFIGLNFADKKEGRGLPAGLVPVSDPFPDGDLPEVEILVGDASKFENTVPLETKPSPEDDSGDVYKPKVSTWGMFPRPSNISKTFGGGRNIRPGQALETPEQKAAKEARTRQLLAAYKSKVGLNMDPKLRAECEKSCRH